MQPAAKQNYFMCATDGSEASKDAYQALIGGLMNIKTDQIGIIHIFNRSKNYLPFHMQPECIENEFDAELIGKFNPDQYRVIMESVIPGKTVKEQILDIVARNKADFLVVGYHGRKGPKQDPTVMGTAVQHIALNAVCPIFIIKDLQDRSTKKDGGYTWLIGVDGSDKSFKAYHEAVKVMDKKRDTVFAVSVKTQGLNLEAAKQKCEMHFKTDGVKGSYQVIQKTDMVQTTEKRLVDYIMGEECPYIDYVAIGNNGAHFASHNDKKYLGSVASGVLRNVKANILFVA